MGYQAQSELKQKEVVDSLSRIGGIELPEITPILGCKNEFRYRNKWIMPSLNADGLP